LDQNKNVLLEGAQGAMLDIDHGTYPFVTSSSTIAGGACIGAGISPRRISKVIGVTKAYTTRVGNGPFPTELNDDIGNFIREKGKEFGTTTGRPRRCGWFDSVVVRRSAMLNGVDEIVVTKLDVLTGLEKVKICESYKFNGNEIKHFPVGLNDDFKPNYIEMEGWNEEISAAKKKDDLPEATVSYLNAFAKSLGNPKISMIGIGPERNQIVEL
jgi:adenylosuccinate synthase